MNAWNLTHCAAVQMGNLSTSLSTRNHLRTQHADDQGGGAHAGGFGDLIVCVGVGGGGGGGLTNDDKHDSGAVADVLQRGGAERVAAVQHLPRRGQRESDAREEQQRAHRLRHARQVLLSAISDFVSCSAVSGVAAPL